MMLLYTTTLSQTIIIGKKGLFIDDFRFDSLSLIKDYINVLGKPSRVFNLASNIYVFDSLGIYIYEDYVNKKIIEIQFDFTRHIDFEFCPRKPFKGSIYLTDYHFYLTYRTSYSDIRRVCTINMNKTFKYDFSHSSFLYNKFSLLVQHGGKQDSNIFGLTIDFDTFNLFDD